MGLIQSFFHLNLFILQVKFWITLNEPWVVSMLGHEYAAMAPGQH